MSTVLLYYLHMLTHSVFTNTTCEEKQPQVHRRDRRSLNSAAGRLQLGLASGLASCPECMLAAQGGGCGPSRPCEGSTTGP